MSGVLDGQPAENGGEEGVAKLEASTETLIDLLTGGEIRSTPKSRLVQKVLRQLIETYGFDRSAIGTGYRPTARGKRSASVDIVIFRHGEDPVAQHPRRSEGHTTCAIDRVEWDDLAGDGASSERI